MSRMSKWFVPALALVLLLGFTEQTRAQQEEKKKMGTVSGTVMTEEGKPAANVRVRVVAPPPKPKEGEQPPATPTGAGDAELLQDDEKQKEKDGEKPRRGRMKPVAEGTTDEQGKFSIENVPVGKFLVVAGGQGQGRAAQPVEVKEGETVTVALQLKPQPPKQQ